MIDFSQYAKVARLTEGEDRLAVELASDMEGVEEGDLDLQGLENKVILNHLEVVDTPKKKNGG